MNNHVLFPPPTDELLRPTVMDVDLDALASNLAQVRELVSPAKVLAVVKANAYGHGLVMCGKHFEEHGADYLGVALGEEGIALRQAGIKLPILVYGGILGTQVQQFLEYELDVTVSSLDKLSAVEQTAATMNTRARVHLKIDTGMERIGVHWYNAETLFKAAVECKHIDIIGVFSHFACADEDDIEHTEEQLARFLEALEFFPKHDLEMPIRHIANSSALVQYPASHLDMVRPGLALYGIYPSAHTRELVEFKPAMSLRSQVVYVKIVRAGAGVSYGYSWKAPSDTRVVTIPIGYGDGYLRALSNRARIMINSRTYPVIGNICMDQLMVDVGDDEVHLGDDVVIIGEQGDEKISVKDIADLAGTVPHEILASINVRIPRRYMREGEIIAAFTR